MIFSSVCLNDLYALDPAFEARLDCYIISNSREIDPHRKRPAVLVCPGGGYRFVSEREGEPVALKLLGYGYNVFVLRYSALPEGGVVFPVQLSQGAAAMDYIRCNSGAHNTDSARVAVCGFSAGGHLAGSISTLYNAPELKTLGFKTCPRPDASVLCYAVLSTAESITHSITADTVSGGDKFLRERLSLDKAVDAATPPAFIWHTADDNGVPAENSLLYAQALALHKVPYELHIFRSGCHGQSVADETAYGDPALAEKSLSIWVPLLKTFLDGLWKK